MSEGTEVVVVESTQLQLGALQVAPEQVIERATQVAGALAKIIKDKNLSSKIRQKEYVRVEGWTTLCAMLGVIPIEVSNVPDEMGVYTSIVELVRTSDGAVVGRASGECGNADEVDRNQKPVWASRPAYARRSMAATRATGKACRLSFSWIVALAGYEPTPAEEVEGVVHNGTYEPVSDAGPRVENQWEQSVLDKIIDLQLVQAKPHAVNIFNRSPFMQIPYGQLKMQDAVAYLIGWSEVKENNPELDTDGRVPIMLAGWESTMRDEWMGRATKALGTGP